jgi:hypothetical protein
VFPAAVAVTVTLVATFTLLGALYVTAVDEPLLSVPSPVVGERLHVTP